MIPSIPTLRSGMSEGMEGGGILGFESKTMK